MKLAEQSTVCLVLAAAAMAGCVAWGKLASAEGDGGVEAQRERGAPLALLPQRLLGRLGYADKGGPIADEQVKHIWRMVRLERLAAIAATTGNPELLERLRALADQERQRHARAMVRLRRSAPTREGER